ncbi:MAG: hypothetical protein PHY93_20140 [Bacteriovorax sp.]|nr:hypothetical protein [Bacteriovorax sp.]
MLKSTWLMIFLSFTFGISSANAYLVTTYKNEVIRYNWPTRILVTGEGKEQDTQFQEVANAKALKYSELYPSEQIILIAKNENKIFNTNKNLLRSWGFFLQSEEKSIFNGEALVKELLKYKKITSIDFFTHGTAQYGLYLENNHNRFSIQTIGIEKLRGHFAEDAYIVMHGCNTGFILAPFLSNTLDIPVSASMTSTDFQRLHSDGEYYLTDKGYFPNGDWARKNTVSYNNETSCRYGKCIRLKPDNHPYVGYWGEYTDGGLPFYKFFCLNNSTEQCNRVMAKSLFSFIGTVNLKFNSSLSEYKKALVDFLCPISARRDIRGECEANLNMAKLTRDEAYNPFRGTLLDCNFKTCNADFKCKKIRSPNFPDAKSCYLINKSNKRSTALVKEYRAYLSGYMSLY